MARRGFDVPAVQLRIGTVLLHDEDVAAGLARTFLIERNRDLTTPETAAIGRFVARAERDMRRHRAAVPRTWRGVGGATFRRSLGRLLAAL